MSADTILPGNGWQARYVADDGTIFDEPVLFFRVTPKGINVTAFVLDGPRKFRAADWWSNFETLVAP